MSEQETSTLLETIDTINHSWLDGRFSELAPLLHEDVVFVAPGFEESIKGRELCAQSYRDFAEAVRVNTFETGTPDIQMWGSTAIAACPFSIGYELDGRSILETGVDLLVFAREGVQWKVVCRTVSSQEVATGEQG